VLKCRGSCRANAKIEDQRFREELKNANIEKFKKVVKRVLAPTKKQPTK